MQIETVIEVIRKVQRAAKARARQKHRLTAPSASGMSSIGQKIASNHCFLNIDQCN
jgi:hypothetical protein